MGPKFALKMGPKFVLTDIFHNKMGRGYLLMNPKKSEVCTLGYVPSPMFFVSLKLVILNLLAVELNACWASGRPGQKV